LPLLKFQTSYLEILFLSVFNSRVFLHRYEAYNGIKIYSKNTLNVRNI